MRRGKGSRVNSTSRLSDVSLRLRLERSSTEGPRQIVMTAKKLETLVTEQFGPQAAAYVASPVHAQGEDLQQLAALVSGHGAARVLDLGCGGGHVSYSIAARVGEVIAYDLSRDMLAAVAAEAGRRGLSNIETTAGPAETLPFLDQSFDFVFCRLTAHHWSDVPAGLKEARRVLKVSGKAVFIDIVSPGPPLLDTFLQTFEMLRDPSHVRNYSVAEWTSMATAAGFVADKVTMRQMPIEFTSWVARMKTPDIHIQAIRSLQQRMAGEVIRRFAIDADGSFILDAMTLELDPA